MKIRVTGFLLCLFLLHLVSSCATQQKNVLSKKLFSKGIKIERQDRFIVANHSSFDKRVPRIQSNKNIELPLESNTNLEVQDEMTASQDEGQLPSHATIGDIIQDKLVEANEVSTLMNNTIKADYSQEKVKKTELRKIKNLSKSGFWVSVVASVPFLMIILSFLLQYESLYTLIPLLGLISLILVIVGLVYSVRAKKRNKTLSSLPTTTDEERVLLSHYRRFSRAGIVISSILLGMLILSIILFIVSILFFFGVLLMGG